MAARTQRSLVNVHHLASLPASNPGRPLLIERPLINRALEVAVARGREVRGPDEAPALAAGGGPAVLQTVHLGGARGDGRHVVAGERLPGLGQPVAGVDGLPAVGSRHPGEVVRHVQVLAS